MNAKLPKDVDAYFSAYYQVSNRAVCQGKCEYYTPLWLFKDIS